MSGIIEPDIDRYGTYARPSSLADFLEASALFEPSMSEPELADYVADSGWARKPDLLFHRPGQGEEELPEGNQVASRAFDMIRERRDLLGSRYPFTIQSNRVALDPSFPDLEESIYLCLLAVTQAHAYGLESYLDPKLVFEGIVTRALQEHGFLAVNLAGEARGAGAFAGAVVAAGERIGLSPTPEEAYLKRFAQDAGVDVVGHLPLGDGRPGRWVAIGQATCAKSNQWEKKIGEASPRTWARVLGLLVSPFPFLAVPHHVPEDCLGYLAQHANGVVLDRMRITMTDLGLQAQERDLIRVLAYATISS